MAKDTSKWQRARRPEQKDERRAAILEAAASLLDQEGLEGTGLNAIARESGVSKPNIYRYYESREAILLRLLLVEMGAWTQRLERRLNALARTGDVDAIAEAFADTIANQPRFCILLGTLATVLEHNVGLETATAFKREFLATVSPAVLALDTALPAISPDQAFTSMAMLIMAASGAWPCCNPAPVVQEALKLPDLASMRFDFKGMMRTQTVALLRGLIAQDK